MLSFKLCDGFMKNKLALFILDPVDYHEVKWEPTQSIGGFKKWRLVSRIIHTGEVGGAVGQSVAFVTSGILLVLVWTGYVMAWQRFYFLVKGRRGI